MKKIYLYLIQCYPNYYSKIEHDIDFKKEICLEISDEQYQKIKNNFGHFKSAYFEANNISHGYDLLLVEHIESIKQNVLEIFNKKVKDAEDANKKFMEEIEAKNKLALQKQKAIEERRQQKNKERKLAKQAAEEEKQKELYGKLKEKFEKE